MKPKLLIITLVSFAILLASAFTAYLFTRSITAKRLPVYNTVQEFSLTDQDGSPFSLAQLKNKIWVADFIFTTCGTICPVMTKNMAALHRSYNMIDNIEFVSISVNPEQDTPQKLTEFASRYDADHNKWHFLTGKRDAISQLARESFKVGHKDEPIFHSPHFILIDRYSQIRGYYDGTSKKEVRNLFKDLAQLMKEQL